jgi:hypothetical protein
MRITWGIISLTLASVITAICVRPWTRTDTVTVTAIDDGYDIRIHSSGRWLFPISPEGPFPKWTDATRFFAEGSGERVDRNGVIYKKYIVGMDLTSTWYSCGTICISEHDKRLIVQGERPADRHDRTTWSGTYDNVVVDHPEILILTETTRIEDIDHRYVRARGHFRKSRLEAAGKLLYAPTAPPDALGTYEVVGVVELHYDPEPSIHIVSYKKVAEQ